jgi:predicted nucleotide-binding protein
MYSHEKKKKLADKISKIKRKETLVKIFEIIYSDNKEITENNNGLFMFFHKLKDSTYEKIEAYLKSLSDKNKSTAATTTTTSSETDSSPDKKKSFVPYTKDEFPAQEGMSPKLKFSNKEKNLIKRKRYDKTVSSNEGGDVKYCNYDAALTDSEK